jgi:hypothetical protein
MKAWIRRCRGRSGPGHILDGECRGKGVSSASKKERETRIVKAGGWKERNERIGGDRALDSRDSPNLAAVHPAPAAQIPQFPKVKTSDPSEAWRKLTDFQILKKKEEETKEKREGERGAESQGRHHLLFVGQLARLTGRRPRR